MKARYVPNSEGLEELLRGRVAQDLVKRHADRIASECGDGYEASYQQGASRYRGIVFPDTWSAKARERRDNRMVRALG
ncbi:hypothetical protein CMUST_15730 (plasmid) [Corynebacterium mustelae]|uniref:Uncharacterized protein n=1 Tax=Corynebacterium mustelae TaxID=571915 RepID=A0A0G3H1Z0_9CORY|nr:hypothetical protein [Corynebacterium mustelae]AKK05240.1 hypothetical protein CMUST_04490 [Corynebacterium mustelae]AKK07434.1 hypothetical protein CMUST_15730 [Corynebacterium mustelae]